MRCFFSPRHTGSAKSVISHVHLCTVSVWLRRNVGAEIRGEKRSAALIRPLKVSLEEVKVTAADGRLLPVLAFQIIPTCYGKTLFKDAIDQSRASSGPLCFVRKRNSGSPKHVEAVLALENQARNHNHYISFTLIY